MLIIRIFLDFKEGIEAKIKRRSQKEKNKKNKNVKEKLSRQNLYDCRPFIYVR